MYILGLSGYAHESSAALLRNGDVRYLIEEERLNREKHTSKFPKMAIQECLRLEGIGIQDVDYITFFWSPRQELTGGLFHFIKFFPKSLHLFSAISGGSELTLLARAYWMQRVRKVIRDLFGTQKVPRVIFVEHHLCHAASAFFVSEFEESAILTTDGRGESTTTLLAVGKGNKIQKLKEIKIPHSLGHLYAAVTSHLGFQPLFDEWKVMGLSAYGKETYCKTFQKVVELLPDGGFQLNLDYFRFHTHGQPKWLDPRFERDFGPKRYPQDPYEQRHFDLALALQRRVEEVGVHLARHLYQQTQLPNLCLTGGVALNCLMNRKIIENTDFQKCFIQPIANDAGTSLGSALYFYHHVVGKKRNYQMQDIYFGPEFGNEEIEEVLKRKKVSYRKCDNIAKETAEWIARDKIVGWFQGRMEAGPRALGNRSITVNPANPKMKEILNRRVKKREFFRPFAPSVLEECVGDYFKMPKSHLSPHMILVGEVSPEKRAAIPAVTHVDNTARVQTVSRKSNRRYWELIREFEKITGIPVLLNTSFNENEPIVCTPEEAVHCFLRTEFDVLAIGDFLVHKEAHDEVVGE